MFIQLMSADAELSAATIVLSQWVNEKRRYYGKDTAMHVPKSMDSYLARLVQLLLPLLPNLQNSYSKDQYGIFPGAD